MKRLFYFILILIIFGACQNTDTKQSPLLISPTPTKHYTFNLDFVRYRANFGRFEKQGTPFFYLYHSIYSKQIDIYNEQQQKVDSISLRQYKKPNNPVVYVEFLNSDTISVRTERGIIYLINSKSELLKVIDVNAIQSQLNDSLLDICYHMEYSKTYQGVLISGFNGEGNPYGFDQYCDLLRYFMKQHIKRKRLILIDNVFADNLTIHHYLKGLEQYIVDKGGFANIIYNTYFLKDKLIMYSHQNEQLYQISLQTGKIEREIPIKSKYPTAIVTPIMKIGEDSEQCLKDIDKDAFPGDEGAVDSFYYSPYTDKYYVGVRHKKQTDSDKEKRYSILIYDTDFNKIGETDLMLEPVGIWSEKGFYINNLSEEVNEKQIKLEYYEFIK